MDHEWEEHQVESDRIIARMVIIVASVLALTIGTCSVMTTAYYTSNGYEQIQTPQNTTEWRKKECP